MSTPNPTFPPLSTGFTWVAPIGNEDGSALVAGELAGYELGIRADGTGSPGTYTVNVAINDPTSLAEPLTALGTVLAPGNYWAAMQSKANPAIGNDSKFTQEFGFSIPAPVLPTLNPPSAFSGS